MPFIFLLKSRNQWLRLFYEHCLQLSFCDILAELNSGGEMCGVLRKVD